MTSYLQWEVKLWFESKLEPDFKATQVFFSIEKKYSQGAKSLYYVHAMYLIDCLIYVLISSNKSVNTIFFY